MTPQPTQSGFNDLRGRAVREVHRDDAVIISGAEYMRLSRIKDTAESMIAGYMQGRKMGEWIADLEDLTGGQQNGS